MPKTQHPKPKTLWFLRLDYFAAAYARRTHAHALCGSANAGVYRAQIDVPAPLGDVMGVADAVT